MATTVETRYTRRARYYSSAQAFNITRPRVPAHVFRAERDRALWIVTNEPELAFERAEPPAPGAAPIAAVHYPADEIRRQLELIHRLPSSSTTVGKAVNLASHALEAERTALPSLTLALNSLLPGESQ